MPDSADTLKKRIALSPEKQALLEKRLRARIPSGLAEVKSVPETSTARSLITSWPPQTALECDWHGLVEAGLQQSLLMPAGFNFEEYVAYQRWFDGYCTAQVCNQLSRRGIFNEAGQSCTVDEIIDRLQVVESYRKLIHRWLLELADAGFLSHDHGVFTNSRPLSAQDPDDPWGGSKDVRKDICNGLIDIVTGKRYAVEYLFAGGSTKVADWGYELGAIAQYFNSIATRIVEKLIKMLPANRKLRILEIGAGVGGTTAALLPILPPERTEYVFTDLSAYFHDNAKSKFRAHGFVYYDIWDINQPPDEIGYKPNTFDLVLAANVLHCARRVSRTLQYLRSMMAPGGLLLMIELTQNRPCQMVFPGVLEGFSHFEDHRLAVNKPLLSAPEWKETCELNGFQRFAAFPRDDNPAHQLGQHTMLAQLVE